MNTYLVSIFIGGDGEGTISFLLRLLLPIMLEMEESTLIDLNGGYLVD